MKSSNRWFLVVGYGSIGRRHYQNLLKLGYNDIRLLRSQIQKKGSFESPEGVKVYTSLDEALSDRPWVVIVSNPTSLHMTATKKALESGAFVILEKPVCTEFHEAELLYKIESTSESFCSMGYCYRYHPLYKKLYDSVAELPC